MEHEYKVVEVKIPKGMHLEGYDLIVCPPDVGDIVLSRSIAEWAGYSLVARYKKLKPDWNPPKLKKGWLTWDDSGWWWWSDMPEYGDENGWMYPENGCDFDNEEIGEAMAELLGFPDCSGFDERNCIWEVGE